MDGTKAKRRSDAFFWFPFFFAEHLAETNHLSDAEHSAYVRLMCKCATVQGPLPDDDRFLSRACGVSVQKWLRLRPRIASMFLIDDGWRLPWLDARIEHARNLSAKRSAAGLKGAEAKIRSDQSRLANAGNSADPNRDKCHGIQTQTHIPTPPCEGELLGPERRLALNEIHKISGGAA